MSGVRSFALHIFLFFLVATSHTDSVKLGATTAAIISTVNHTIVFNIRYDTRCMGAWCQKINFYLKLTLIDLLSGQLRGEN